MKTLILRGPGTNCDHETAFAFQEAGSQTKSVHVNQLLKTPEMLVDFQAFCIPGGFSFGDDLGAGRVLGWQLKEKLGDSLRKFRDDGKLILGICNGFQVLLNCGLLVPANTDGAQTASLTLNDCGHFQDRWVYLETCGNKSAFLNGIDRMAVPMAHAEGKFVTDTTERLEGLEESGQLVLRYRSAIAGEASLGDLPANPNGSMKDVAGICDQSGRVLGLMPHPERHITRTHHFQWTRLDADYPTGDGMAVFKNAVDFFA